MYADDTVFHVSHRCPETLEKNNSGRILNVNEWLLDHELSLDKTERMIFSPKSKIKEGEVIKVETLKSVAE